MLAMTSDRLFSAVPGTSWLSFSSDIHVAIAQQSFRHQACRRVRQNIRLESLVEPHHNFNIVALLGNMTGRARDKLDRFNVSDIDPVQPHRRSI